MSFHGALKNLAPLLPLLPTDPSSAPGRVTKYGSDSGPIFVSGHEEWQIYIKLDLIDLFDIILIL